MTIVATALDEKSLEAVLKIFRTAFFGKKSAWQKRYCPFEYGKIRLWHLAESQNFLPPDIFKTASYDRKKRFLALLEMTSDFTQNDKYKKQTEILSIPPILQS